MRKRKTIQIISALALLLVFFAACGDPYQPEVAIRRVNFPDTLTLKEGDFKPLKVTIIKPSIMSGTVDVTWISDDDSVAIVEIIGDDNAESITISKTTTIELLVTAIGEGTAIITVTAETPGPDIEAECVVTVTGSGTAVIPDTPDTSDT